MNESNLCSKYILSGFQTSIFCDFFFNLDFRKTFIFESPSRLCKSYPLSTFLYYGDKHETELGEEKCVKSLKAFTNSSSKYFGSS